MAGSQTRSTTLPSPVGVAARSRAPARHRLLLELGRGGMGTVYLGVVDGPGGVQTLRAVKRLRRELALDTNALHMFLDEARITARLRHPNIVQTFDVGFDAGHHFIEMEYLEGQSLDALLRLDRGGEPLPLPVLLWILTQALAGLHHAHEARELGGQALQVVHRDVSPHNVFVTYDGQVKVLDFGIAKAADSRGETQSGVVRGKIVYFAPEQARREPLDRRVDVFATGVILWQMLTRDRLWSDMSDLEVCRRLEVGRIERPSLRHADIPAELEAICLRALEPDRDARYPTAAAFQAELEAYLDAHGERVGARACAQLLDAHFADARSELRQEIEAALGDEPREAPPPRVDTSPATGSGSRATVEAAARSPLGAGLADSARPARPRRTWPRPALVLVAGLALLGAVVGGALWSRRGAPASAPAEASRAEAAPTATSVLDLALPTTTQPAASTAYRDGLAAFRASDIARATRELRRAVAFDPTLAAAHLRLALWLSVGDSVRSREAFEAVLAQRDRLSARDAALLAALEPCRADGVVDLALCRDPLRALTAAFPADAELAYVLLWAEALAGDLPRALAEADRALALDPAFAEVLASRAHLERQTSTDSTATVERCVAIAPRGTGCLAELAQEHAVQGRCASAEAAARRWLEVDPGSRQAHETLAGALLSLEKPRAEVEVVLRAASAADDSQHNSTMSPGGGALDLQHAVALDVLAGDFDAALVTARALASEVAGAEEETAHEFSTRTLLQLLGEAGEVEQAADLAERYLRLRSAWRPDPASNEGAVSRDVRPLAWQALRAAGRMDAEALRAERDAWLSDWARRTPAALGAWPAVQGWVAFATSPEDARAALAAARAAGPLPALGYPLRPVDLHLGRALRLAGETAAAERHLRRAARRCHALEEPFERVRASHELGLWLEEAGDREGACQAYGLVRRHWGAARPRSLTAAAAAARQRALGCGS